MKERQIGFIIENADNKIENGFVNLVHKKWLKNMQIYV